MPRLPLLCIFVAVLAPWAGRAQPAAERVPLTEEERAFVAAHPVVVAGYGAPYAPYSFPGRDGKLAGMDVDYLNLIARLTGLRFDNRAFLDWPTAIGEFKAGRVDVLTSLARIPEREAYTIYTRAYTSVPNVIVTRADTPSLVDPRELKGRRVGVDRGFGGLIALLRRLSPGCIVVEINDTTQALEAVADGSLDAAFADVVDASYAMKAQHLANLRLGTVISDSEDNFIGVRKGLPLLAQIIDKAVAAITPLERKEIDDRWIGIDLAPSRWVRAGKVAAGVAAIAVVIFLLAFVHSRRLSRELAERRRVQDALEHAHATLARVSEEKSALLHMVAHDLRSPLTAFQLGAEMLQGEEPGLSGPGRETLASLFDAVRLMQRMVDDLVDVHMLEQGRRDYQSAEVELCGLVRDSVAAFAETAARKEIRLALETPEPALSLRTDPRALRQVVDNLISNAVKYSPARSEVRIDLRRDGGRCRLEVADSGPGVRPDERESIFEKYTLGSAVPTGGEKSTGLGLWIVRRIVTALHGRVWCESKAGRGAVFIVEVPLGGQAA